MKNLIKVFVLFLLMFSDAAFCWEINTHRAINRCAISGCDRKDTKNVGNRSKNLAYFVKNMKIEDESYESKFYLLDNYTLEDGKTPVTYFEYVTNGETNGISINKWPQSFNSYGYKDLMEAGAILEDQQFPPILK